MTSHLAAVVFDFDGIVLDSETPEYESHRRVFERCGATLSVDEWCGTIGLWLANHHERWHRALAERARDAPDWETFRSEQRRIFEAILSGEPMPGILGLLEALEREGVPTAIASSAPARWVVAAAQRIGVAARFGAVVTGDQVGRRKPDPDVYLEAVRRLGADPARSVAVEDSAPGLASAKAAGLKTVAIPHWLTASHDFGAADLTVAHAGELTPSRLATLVSP